MGAWAIGGAGWWHAWGAQDDEESIATLRRGFELGINWVDTAPIYGLGHSEEVVGRALEGLAERPYVFTKASLLDGGDNSVRHNLKRDSLLREIEASLTRLRVDVIDVYQVHWPDPDEDVEEGWSTFAEIKEQGLVRHIGVSNFDVGQLRRAQAIAPVETLQPPYSLLERAVEDEVLPFAAERGHRRRLLLADGLGPADRRDDGRAHRAPCPTTTGASTTRASRSPSSPRTWPSSRACRRSPSATTRRAGAIAVAWTLHHPAVHGSIVGFRRPDQVQALALAGNVELTDEDLAMIAGA